MFANSFANSHLITVKFLKRRHENMLLKRSNDFILKTSKILAARRWYASLRSCKFENHTCERLGLTQIAHVPHHQKTPIMNAVSQRNWFSNDSKHLKSLDDPLLFEQISEETLESLTECFEELLERPGIPADSDASLSSGVLNVYLGSTVGTYVINKQGPNRQIWLSSPVSGPKRYDFVSGVWLYKHDGKTLHQLLTQEIRQVLKEEVDFRKCSYGSTSNGI